MVLKGDEEGRVADQMMQWKPERVLLERSRPVRRCSSASELRFRLREKGAASQGRRIEDKAGTAIVERARSPAVVPEGSRLRECRRRAIIHAAVHEKAGRGALREITGSFICGWACVAGWGWRWGRRRVASRIHGGALGTHLLRLAAGAARRLPGSSHLSKQAGLRPNCSLQR